MLFNITYFNSTFGFLRLSYLFAIRDFFRSKEATDSTEGFNLSYLFMADIAFANVIGSLQATECKASDRLKPRAF